MMVVTVTLRGGIVSWRMEVEEGGVLKDSSIPERGEF
jgi:hypothetical protein